MQKLEAVFMAIDKRGDGMITEARPCRGRNGLEIRRFEALLMCLGRQRWVVFTCCSLGFTQETDRFCHDLAGVGA